ncbi:gamma-glutamyltransferase family protein [Brevibacterium litoralis]|uniref:gamma-glutamyltransferase family protein n=1 Tax=Brevibacterium litoralis TaxID=3138935 RepID=UPI0032EAA519
MHAPTPRNPPYRAMIVTPQPEATDAGAEVLHVGGNAVDAAVAAALVQGVVDPLMCGLGGMAVIQIARPDGRRHVIDGLGSVPLNSTDDQWESIHLGQSEDGFNHYVEGMINETGPTAVTTPGALRAWQRAHEAYGSLPWADLFEAATRTARAWMWRPHNATMAYPTPPGSLRMGIGDKLGVCADGRRIYLDAAGNRPAVGQVIENPELAETLAHLAAHGAEDFYTGELAGVLGTAVRDAGGIMDAADLAAYELLEPAPITGSYRGLEVSVPPPNAGGVQTMETLALMDRFDVAGLDHNSPEHVRILVEAQKHALHDKERLWSTPDADRAAFEALLEPARLDAIAARIRDGERFDLEGSRAGLDLSFESKDTTHLNVMDDSGFTVSMSHTLGTPSGFIAPGTGFMLNGAMQPFDPRPGRTNSIVPGARRNTTMTPTIVFHAGEPVVSIGAPGAAWITPAIAQGLSNVLDFGMTAQEAVMAPRVVATNNTIDVSNAVPGRTRRALTDLGYTVRPSPLTYAFAGVHAITRFDGTFAGGADPQRDGYAAGVR